MGKRSRPFVIIFLVIIVTSSIVYFHTNSNNFIYAQVELQDSPAGLKITSPATGQKVQVGQLEVKGTSTDDATTDCQVYVDLNDIKPMQKTTAVGSGGVNDYSNWAFKYTNNYHLIPEGVNELTARMTCIDNAERLPNITVSMLRELIHHMLPTIGNQQQMVKQKYLHPQIL
jgi:hypothetical protein